MTTIFLFFFFTEVPEVMKESVKIILPSGEGKKVKGQYKQRRRIITVHTGISLVWL